MACNVGVLQSRTGARQKLQSGRGAGEKWRGTPPPSPQLLPRSSPALERVLPENERERLRAGASDSKLCLSALPEAELSNRVVSASWFCELGTAFYC